LHICHAVCADLFSPPWTKRYDPTYWLKPKPDQWHPDSVCRSLAEDIVAGRDPAYIDALLCCVEMSAPVGLGPPKPLPDPNTEPAICAATICAVIKRNGLQCTHDGGAAPRDDRASSP
jgi:hypothetical protein